MHNITKNLILRSLGITVTKCTKLTCDTSFLLEDFESLSSDEYIIIGEDDGTMVPPLACEFCKVKSQGHILALADENGYVVLYNTNKTGTQSIIKDWQAHTNAVFDLTWMDGEEKLLTGSGDQTISLWDVPTSQKIDVFKGHTSSVRSVNFQTNSNAVFSSGSRDGHIMIWDTRCSKKDGHRAPVNVIRNAHSLPSQPGSKAKRKIRCGRDSQMSVTAVKFQSSTDLFSAGAVDGCVKLWDLRKNYMKNTGDVIPKHIFTYCGMSKRKHGYSSLVFDSTQSRLFASCTDDIIYQFDAVSLNPRPVNCYRGHQNSTFYIKASISPDDRFILTGSSDEMAYIYQIDKPKQRPVVLKGYRAEVSDVKWSPTEMNKLATLSDDSTFRLWRLHRRPFPPCQGEVSGTAERTHREIGISADGSEQHRGDNSGNDSTTSFPQITPSKSSHVQIKTEGKSPSMGPSSIKEWLSLSAQKKQKELLQNKGEGIGQSSIEEMENKNMNKNPEKKCENVFGKERLPCKRKLVDAESFEDEENPRKRLNIQESPIRTVWNSPRKIQDSPRKLQIKPSPRKQEQTLCRGLNILQDIGSRLDSDCNSPKKCDGNNSQKSSPATRGIVEHKLFSNTMSQSPTVNLPNLVLDGNLNRINLHHKISDKENSPQKCDKLDWLTKIRLQKSGKSLSELNVMNMSPRRTLFDKLCDSPTSSHVTSSQSSQNTSEFSQWSQGESKSIVSPKTPKGMKSLRHYFQTK